MRRAARIAQRELLESLRDARVLGMFLFPLITYPAMLWAVSQALVWSVDQRAVLAWESADVPALLADADVDWVEGGRAAYDAGRADGWVAIEQGPLGVTVRGSVKDTDRSALAGGLAALRRAQAARVAPELPAAPPKVRLHVEEDEPLDVGQILEELAPVAPIGPVLVLILLLNMMVYPAVDSAQERTRGTLSTTLLGPQTDREVVWGKVMATSALALMSTMAQVFVTCLSAAHMVVVALATVDDLTILWPELPAVGGIVVVLMVLPLATMTNVAAFLAVCVRFKSQPDALAAASVLMTGMMVWFGAGAFAGPWAALMPVANVVPLMLAALGSELSAAQVAVMVSVNLLTLLGLVELATRNLRRALGGA